MLSWIGIIAAFKLPFPHRGIDFKSFKSNQNSDYNYIILIIFGTKLNFAWCQINRKSVIIIYIWLNSFNLTYNCFNFNFNCFNYFVRVFHNHELIYRSLYILLNLIYIFFIISRICFKVFTSVSRIIHINSFTRFQTSLPEYKGNKIKTIPPQLQMQTEKYF